MLRRALSSAPSDVVSDRRAPAGADADGPIPTAPSTSARRIRIAALLVLVAAEATWIVTRDVLEGGVRWLPLLVVIPLHLGLVLWEHRQPVLGARTVLVASAVVAVVAVVVPPFGSRDVYLYATYGRMVTWYQVNPYLSGAGVDPVAGDALRAHVAPAWRSVPSAYGPVFTAWSALGAVLYGDSPLRARLFFQASVGAALVAGTWYLHRRGRSTAVLLAVGLSPVLVATVNGGHLDLLAGLAAMVGVDLVTRRRPVAGAVLVGVACAVKLLLLPVAAVVVLAPLLSGRRRDAATTAAVIGGLLAGLYLVVGGMDALAPLRDLNQAVSRGSLWGALSHDPSANELLRVEGWARPLAAGVVLLGLALVVWRARRPIDVVVVSTAAGVVVCFGADYALPWYAAGFLLIGALAPSVPSWALAAGATVQLLVYLQPPGRAMGDLVGAINAVRVGGGALAILLVGTVAWMVVTRGRPPATEVSPVDGLAASDADPGPVVSRTGS